MVRFFYIIIVIVLFNFLLVSCGSKKQNPEKVIVEVGSEKLTLDILKQQIPFDSKNVLTDEQIQSFIQRWIEHELLYQEALRLGMNRDYLLNQILKKAEKEFLVNKLLDSLLSKDIVISDDELHKYYELNKDNFMRAMPVVRAYHILVSDRKKAWAIRRRILRGEDFKKVAREVSLDYVRNKRIDMGYFSPDDVVPQIAAAIFNWKIGSITKPIKSEFGFHIFKIIDKKPPNTLCDYEEVKDQINTRLLAEKKKELYRDFISDLKSKMEIKTNYEYLNELYTDTLQTNLEVIKDSL